MKLGETIANHQPQALQVSDLLEDLKELSLGVFHGRMPAWAYRTLGRAIEKIPRQKLRFFLECAEEVLGILRDHTNWEGHSDLDRADLFFAGALGILHGNRMLSINNIIV